ncbi:MAG: radical SAM protein [Dissulfurispiraceae bacterium]
MDKTEFTADRTGTGTKEWSEHSVNIGRGCSHGCVYCYARSMALRFGRIKNRDDWALEVVDTAKVRQRRRAVSGITMFPTTHDISPMYLPHVVTVLQKILAAGNKVLIVSKPHLECIKELCARFGQYKGMMLFRFTIGTLNPEVSKFWEPGAPLPEERLQSLAYAYNGGFATSVSMEPMLLGRHDAINTFAGVEQYVTETIWLGKMNKARQRVDISRPDLMEAVGKIESLQSDKEIKRLYDALRDHPKVQWKDSIKEVMSAATS